MSNTYTAISSKVWFKEEMAKIFRITRDEPHFTGLLGIELNWGPHFRKLNRSKPCLVVENERDVSVRHSRRNVTCSAGRGKTEGLPRAVAARAIMVEERASIDRNETTLSDA